MHQARTEALIAILVSHSPVRPAAARSQIDYRTQTRMAVLGTFPTVGLEEARELARERRKLVKAGGDPVVARRAEREQAEREDAEASIAAQLASASTLRAAPTTA